MKKVLSVLLSLCMLIAFVPLTAYGSSVSSQQLFKSDDEFKKGITVFDNGDIYAITGESNIKGFKSDGSSNGFSATLPSSYCGNLCSQNGVLFAHTTNSSQIFLYEPSKSNACKTLYAGLVCHSLAATSDGYLYALQGETNSAGKKVSVIRRAKISKLTALNNEDYISWEKSYYPDYEAPNSDGNAYPKALAVDTVGNAYIVDKGSSNGYDASVNGIYRYNLNSGRITAMKFVDTNSALVGLTWLYSVNVDSFGNVAVLSRNSDMIVLFRYNHTMPEAFISTSGWVEDLSSDAEGNLYYNSYGNVNTGNCIYKCKLNNVSVTGVSVAPSAKTITVGASFNISSNVSPSNATNKALVFKSSNTAVATVSENGTVKGIKTGTAVVTVNSVQGNFSAKCTVKVDKAANPLIVKAKKPTVKYSKLKKKNQTIALKKWITVSKAQGKVTYKKSSGNKKITVASNGKITVKKGLKKGTYKVKIKVTAAGNASYKAATKTVTVTIKVK